MLFTEAIIGISGQSVFPNNLFDYMTIVRLIDQLVFLSEIQR